MTKKNSAAQALGKRSWKARLKKKGKEASVEEMKELGRKSWAKRKKNPEEVKRMREMAKKRCQILVKSQHRRPNQPVTLAPWI